MTIVCSSALYQALYEELQGELEKALVPGRIIVLPGRAVRIEAFVFKEPDWVQLELDL